MRCVRFRADICGRFYSGRVQAEVKFENDGKTVTTPGNVTMRDVTAATCIKWAYGVQDSQIAGPDWLQSEHFDIVAKAGDPVTDDQLKLMMQALLADRFKLSFHRQNKELRPMR